MWLAGHILDELEHLYACQFELVNVIWASQPACKKSLHCRMTILD
jgi:hypothetical protein